MCRVRVNLKLYLDARCSEFLIRMYSRIGNKRELGGASPVVESECTVYWVMGMPVMEFKYE